MSDDQFTPGPWKASGDHVQTDNGVFYVVAQCYTGCDAGRYEARANARLIASAPELLAACRMVVARWERGDLAEAARACSEAIALAEAA